MPARRWNTVLIAALLAAAALTGACRRTFVIVPRPDGGYRPPMDTLRTVHRGNEMRVTFYFDTLRLVRTVYRTDTLWRDGVRVDTVRVVRRDTVRVGAGKVDTVRLRAGKVDTIRIVSAKVDTVRVGVGTPQRVRVDTVRVVMRDTVVLRDTVVRTRTAARVDTVRIDSKRVDTVRLVRPDTVYVRRADTVTVMRTDTVRLARVDTVRLAGRRTLFVPPGHYPPQGQCRVWIHDRPPGQQSNAAPCDALGSIPAGAFVLFGGEAWDFDYDWVAEEGRARVPPQIVALKRRR